MLDTIVLTLDQQHFEVLLPERFSPSARGLLTQPYYSLGSRGTFACFQNPRKSDLKMGRYEPRLTLNKRTSSRGSVVSLKVEFSAPKLLLGNNFDELETEDFVKVLAILHRRLTEMRIHVSMDALRAASVSAIHYSKNIAFTDYTTCSMVLSELARIDLTTRLDLAHTAYRNEGHAIRYHALSPAHSVPAFSGARRFHHRVEQTRRHVATIKASRPARSGGTRPGRRHMEGTALANCSCPDWLNCLRSGTVAVSDPGQFWPKLSQIRDTGPISFLCLSVLTVKY
jgi:hypothetical protein